ncbi:IS701 family transposase [Micromonospora sp. DT229]|uniref:IS701 family transposase n=1 Tax=Micromonospora sp. DT229 TaxID=3393430 RepID=UPI003CF7ED11
MFARVAARFGRVEPRRRARAYLLGLLAPLPRKTGWQLAEAAGESRPDGMQRLLNGARWDADRVRDDLRAYVVEHLGHPAGVLVVDEAGFVKKGARSAGVERQILPGAEQAENCQIGVFLAYATPVGQALIDRELYLPRSWAADPPRCAGAGVPAHTRYAARPAQAAAMLSRAFDAGVPARWVAAGEPYGPEPAFRAFLERRGVGYVVELSRRHTVALPNGPVRVATIAGQAPERAWKRVNTGAGSGRLKLADWAMGELPGGGVHGRWLLIRRVSGEPDEFAFFLCSGPADTEVGVLARVAESVPAARDCLQRACDEAGLDRYQVRQYGAWYRHVTLALLAQAYVAVRIAQGPPGRTTVAPGRRTSDILWRT